ncbi:MAG: hypothetical protein V4706_14765 [Pseudomonadota bacterium]
MKTTFKLTGGGQLVISPMPYAGTVHVMHLAGDGRAAVSFEIPADLAGVFGSAIECAAVAAVEGKGSEACKLTLTIGPASKIVEQHIPMRCPDADKYLAKYVSKTPGGFGPSMMGRGENWRVEPLRGGDFKIAVHLPHVGAL